MILKQKNYTLVCTLVIVFNRLNEVNRTYVKHRVYDRTCLVMIAGKQY